MIVFYISPKLGVAAADLTLELYQSHNVRIDHVYREDTADLTLGGSTRQLVQNPDDRTGHNRALHKYKCQKLGLEPMPILLCSIATY